MATIILENLPDNLVEQIQKLAQQNDQSVNEQIISILQTPNSPQISYFS